MGGGQVSTLLVYARHLVLTPPVLPPSLCLHALIFLVVLRLLVPGLLRLLVFACLRFP